MVLSTRPSTKLAVVSIPLAVDASIAPSPLPPTPLSALPPLASSAPTSSANSFAFDGEDDEDEDSNEELVWEAELSSPIKNLPANRKWEPLAPSAGKPSEDEESDDDFWDRTWM